MSSAKLGADSDNDDNSDYNGDDNGDYNGNYNSGNDSETDGDNDSHFDAIDLAIASVAATSRRISGTAGRRQHDGIDNGQHGHDDRVEHHGCNVTHTTEEWQRVANERPFVAGAPGSAPNDHRQHQSSHDRGDGEDEEEDDREQRERRRERIRFSRYSIRDTVDATEGDYVPATTNNINDNSTNSNRNRNDTSSKINSNTNSSSGGGSDARQNLRSGQRDDCHGDDPKRAHRHGLRYRHSRNRRYPNKDHHHESQSDRRQSRSSIVTIHAQSTTTATRRRRTIERWQRMNCDAVQHPDDTQMHDNIKHEKAKRQKRKQSDNVDQLPASTVRRDIRSGDSNSLIAPDALDWLVDLVLEDSVDESSHGSMPRKDAAQDANSTAESAETRASTNFSNGSVHSRPQSTSTQVQEASDFTDDDTVGPQIQDDDMNDYLPLPAAARPTPPRVQPARQSNIHPGAVTINNPLHDGNDDGTIGQASYESDPISQESGETSVTDQALISTRRRRPGVQEALAVQQYDPVAHAGLYTAQGEVVDDASTWGTSQSRYREDGNVLHARASHVPQPLGQEQVLTSTGSRRPRGNRIINVVDPTLGEPVTAEEMEREIVDADGNVIQYEEDGADGNTNGNEGAGFESGAGGDNKNNNDNTTTSKRRIPLTPLTAVTCLSLAILFIIATVMLTSACSLFPELGQCNDDDSGNGAGSTPTHSPASPATTFLTSLRCEGSVAVGIDGEAVDLLHEGPPTATAFQTSGGASRHTTQTTIGCDEKQSWTGYHSWIAIDGLETDANGGGEAINVEMASDSSLATWMVAFDGASCDDLGCAIAFGNCATRQCALVIPAAKRESVTVAIGGMEPFDYTIRSQLIASNDRCEIARSLDVILSTTSESEASMSSTKSAVIVTGSYEYATPADTSLASCGVKSGVATWYSVKTNVSGVVTASTCIDNGSGGDSSVGSTNATPDSAQGNAPAYITVFTGDCGNLQCATETKSVSCGLRNQVTWYSESDEEYFLVVSAPPAGHPDWDPAEGLSKTSTSASTNGNANNRSGTTSRRTGLRSSASPSAPAAISTSASTLDPADVDYQLSCRQTADNDICHTAQPIDGFSSFSFRKLHASHHKATSDDAPSCILSSVRDVVDRRGTWYVVNGTESLMNISTCLDDNYGDGGIPFQSVKAQVFKGSCDDLKCLDSVETVFNRGCRSPHETGAELDGDSNFNEVAWQSNLDETYFIHISSKQIPNEEGTNSIAPVDPSTDTNASTKNGTTTDIGLSPSPEFAFSIQSTVRNDMCEAAISLDVGGNVSVHASTMEATVPIEFTSSCYLASRVVSPGVWYTVVGEDSYITINTCKSLDMGPFELDPSILVRYPSFSDVANLPSSPNETTFRLFDNQITVLTGSNCNALRCVAGHDEEHGECVTQSKLTWYAQRNRRYFILVHSALSGMGEFILSTEKLTRSEYDERCYSANLLEIGEVARGSTINSSPAFGPYCGGDFEPRGAAKWFKFVGNGKRLFASTCNTITSYSSRITVLEGDDCRSLSCSFSWERGFCPFTGWYGSDSKQAYMELDTKANVTYHVIVHGDPGQAGRFGLTISEAIPNDQCDGAVGLELDDESIQTSSMIVKTSVAAACDTSFTAESVTMDAIWFEVTSPAARSQLSLHICALSRFIDMDVHVYSYAGDCARLQCITSQTFYRWSPGTCTDDTQPRPELTWVGEPHHTYRIAIDVNNFFADSRFKTLPLNISVSSDPVNDNVVCHAADLIGIGDSINGSFKRAAQDEDIISCYIQGEYLIQRRQDLVGVWYAIIGTGRQMIASSCLDQVQTTPTIVIVMEGECGNLTCIDSSTHFCGLNGQVIWESEVGMVYHVWIGTERFSKINYSLHVADSSPTSSTSPSLVVPSVTSAPTPWKTWIDVDFPPYDECKHAVTLELTNDTSSTSDSTADMLISTTMVTKDNNVGMCGAIYPQVIGGAWFRVHGMNEMVKMTVDTTELAGDTLNHVEDLTRNAKFVVYQSRQELEAPSSDCERLQCVHGNSQDEGKDGPTFATWFAEEGVNYYVLVYNAHPSIAVRLTPIEHTQAGATCGHNVVNGKITNVIERDVTILSMTRGRDVPSEPVPSVCEGQVGSPHNNGAWFSFIGDGKRVRASTSSTASNTNMTVVVYEGDSCDTLTCTAATQHEDVISIIFDSRYTTVTSHQVADWTTKPGQTYTIFVHANNAGNDNSATNIQHLFELTISTLRSMDTCDKARPARFGKLIPLIERNELGPDITDSQCDDPSAGWWDSPGAWYKVVGDGTMMAASTCKEDYILPRRNDTHVSVYSGSCGALTCVGQSHKYCNGDSQVAWPSETGTTYYVLIRHSKRSRSFDMPNREGTTLDSVPQASSTCSGIVTTPLKLEDEMKFVIPASIETGDPESHDGNLLPSCDFKYEASSRNALWLSVKGSGGYLMLTTEGFDTRFNSTVEIYAGRDCDQLSCVNGAVQSRTNGWLSEAGTMTFHPNFADGPPIWHGSISWQSTIAEEYFIRIASVESNKGAVSTAEDVGESAMADSNALAGQLVSVKVKLVLENDHCENAIPLHDGDDVVVDGLLATIDDMNLCNFPWDPAWNETRSDNPGVWYKIAASELAGERFQFQGTVLGMRVTFCGGNVFTKIGIFLGDDCSTLRCHETITISTTFRCVTFDLPKDLDEDVRLLMSGAKAEDKFHFSVDQIYA